MTSCTRFDFCVDILTFHQVRGHLANHLARTRITPHQSLQVRSTEGACFRCYQLTPHNAHAVTEWRPQALEQLLEDLLSLHAELSIASFAGILRRMRLKFPMQTQLAEQSGNRQLAADTFVLAQSLPSASTEMHIKADGYHINGQLYPGSDLVICYKDCAPFVLKPLTEREAHRVQSLTVAAGGRVHHPGVVPFELLWENLDKKKYFMIMPQLPATLELMPPLNEAQASELWVNMCAALQYLHELGFAHCDVKPANICARVLQPLCDACSSASSRFVLIDLGSAQCFGEATQSTSPYIPHDFIGGARQTRSSKELDWWMLGMTLAELCCGKEGLCVGSGRTSLSRRALLQHLEMHLPRALWEDTAVLRALPT